MCVCVCVSVCLTLCLFLRGRLDIQEVKTSFWETPCIMHAGRRHMNPYPWMTNTANLCSRSLALCSAILEQNSFREWTTGPRTRATILTTRGQSFEQRFCFGERHVVCFAKLRKRLPFKLRKRIRCHIFEHEFGLNWVYGRFEAGKTRKVAVQKRPWSSAGLSRSGPSGPLSPLSPSSGPVGAR